MRRLSLLTLIVVLLGLPGAASCPLPVKGGDAVSVGIYIAPVGSGTPVVDYESRRLLTPASIMKSLTVATAYRILGPDWRWSTAVMCRGRVEDGVLHGDLVIRGSGDPTLGSRHFKEQPSFCSAVAAALRRRGISSVEGGVVIDSSVMPEGGAVQSWEVEDIAWDYGAGAYAVNYSDNTFSLTVPDMRTNITVPGLEVVNNLSGKGRSLSLMRGVGCRTLTVGGSLGNRRQATLQCSMPNPGEVLVARLESALSALGIAVGHYDVEPAADDPCEIVLEYKSPPLSEVGRSLMVRSDNMMAEATLRALAPSAPLDSALVRERRFWKDHGVDMSLWRIKDGSGLSRANAISAAALGDVMRQMAAAPGVSQLYIDSFARAGLDGTLTSFLSKNQRKREFVLKSGSMGGVQCYAGFRIDPDTRDATHVIVVMVNNFSGSRSELRKAVENLLLNSF